MRENCLCPGAMPAMALPEGGWTWRWAEYVPDMGLMWSVMDQTWILDADAIGAEYWDTDFLILPVAYGNTKEYVYIRKSLLADILSALGADPNVERGGIIGCAMKEPRCISHFYFDNHGESDERSYRPCAEELNAILAQWHAQKVSLAGVLHTHPEGNTALTPGDLNFVRSLLRQNPALDHFLMGVYAIGKGLFLYGFRRDFLQE